MTVTDLIYAAARHASIIKGAGQTASPREIADSFGELNRMLGTWKADGAPVDVFAAATDTVTLEADAQDAIVYNLAERLASIFHTQISGDVLMMARQTYASFRAHSDATPSLTVDPAVMPARWGSYNILTNS